MTTIKYKVIMKKFLFMLPILAVCFASCEKDKGNNNDEIIQFNDPNFLETLLNYTYDYGYGTRVIIDSNGDGQISYTEAQLFSGEMALSAELTEEGYAYQIHNIDEIKYFTSLTCLSCLSHKVEYVDLSANTRLETVEIGYNGLKKLNISRCAVLKELICHENITLDLSNNAALDYLNCSDCQMTTLDVSRNPALTVLRCNDNQLTTLDISKNTDLQFLQCRNNPLQTLIISDSQQNASWLDDVKSEYPDIEIIVK